MRALDYLTVVLLLAFALHAQPDGEASRGAPGAAPPAETRGRPLFERVELDGPTLARHQRLFAYHDILQAPAFRVDGAGSTPLTIFFMRLPEVARGAFSTPAIAAVEPGTQKHWELELTAYDEGNLVAIEDFDVQDTDGDGRPEILFVALFETVGREPVREFRRGFQLVRGDDGQLVKTLGSWEVREDASIATIGGLVAALDALRAEKHCPDLSKDMDDTTTVAAVRCMVDNDRRPQLAASVLYPLQVLLPSGVVRMLKGPAELLEVYDQVIDARLRAALREGKTDYSYWGMRIGHAGLVVDQGQIGPVFNVDRDANRRMVERLGTDNREVWRVAPWDDVCRTRNATHVFSFALERGARRFLLSTWNDPKADVRKRPPDRVLFGILETHGTCGNDNYTFFGPDGDVGYHHVACYGPEPEPEYSVTGGPGEGPCLNHRMLR